MKLQLKLILICDSPLTLLHHTFVIFLFVYDCDLSTKYGKLNRSALWMYVFEVMFQKQGWPRKFFKLCRRQKLSGKPQL
jgi:hypothetical protein